MNIGPVERVNGSSKNKPVRYYYNEREPRTFLEMFENEVRRISQEEGKEEKDKKEEKSQQKKRKKIFLRKSRNRRIYKLTNLEIYEIETKKSEDSKVYNRLNAKDESDIIPEYKIKPKLNMDKIMSAYNKTPKKPEEITSRQKQKSENIKIEEDNKTKQEPKTKKEEVREFKQEIAKKEKSEKSDLDKAYDDFIRTLYKKNAYDEHMRKKGYRGYEK